MWIVELDEPSFLCALNVPKNELSLDVADIVMSEHAHCLMLCLSGELEERCVNYTNQDVVVKGGLFHAHTAHHYTPLLMSVEEILPENGNVIYSVDS